MWEITEVQFAHLLPNFVECWWDALILDVIICNGIGIWVGLKICKLMEMREFKWVSILLFIFGGNKTYGVCKLGILRI